MSGYIDTDTAPETLTGELGPLKNAKPEQLAVLIEQYLRTIREDLLKMWQGQWRWLDDGTNVVLQYFDTTTDAWTGTGLAIASDGSIHATGMKSGTDQSDAGAAVGELYVDTNDDNSVKRGV